MKRYFRVTAAALVMAGGAVAQAPVLLKAPDGGFGLLRADTNADGRLTRSEFDANQRVLFDAIDANKDGYATPDEMQAAFDARRSDAEQQRFAALDTDRNGQLSEAEFATGRDRGPGPDGPRLRFGGGPGGPGGPRGDRMGPPDADGDGRITFAEFGARPNEAFGRADADKDGTVTIAELQAMAPGKR